MNDKEFIQKFKKITIAEVCREIGANYYNVVAGRAGYYTTKKVVNAIQEKLTNLLDEKNQEDEKLGNILD